MNPDKDLYTDQALETLMANIEFESTEATVTEVFESVKAHRGDAQPSDDITVLALSLAAAK